MDDPKKIIIAEDNLADVELAKLAFKEITAPYKLVHVPDGEELLHYLEQTPLGEIVVVLLDLNMPRLGGIDVLKIFYDDLELQKLPVVIFTSSAHEADVRTCYEYGANAYVCKPIDINDFINVIKSITDFWGGVNILPSFNGRM